MTPNEHYAIADALMDQVSRSIAANEEHQRSGSPGYLYIPVYIDSLVRRAEVHALLANVASGTIREVSDAEIKAASVAIENNMP